MESASKAAPEADGAELLLVSPMEADKRRVWQQEPTFRNKKKRKPTWYKYKVKKEYGGMAP